MKLEKVFLFSLAICLAVLAVWEFYCRGQGYVAAPTDDKALWATHRAKLETMTGENVAILGSSRAHFALQLDEWESVTGIRPLMLACDGSTPTPILQDIVDNSAFKGTLVIGVMPLMFFTAPMETTPMWRRSANRVHHYHARTYAQRLNHHLLLALDGRLAFLNSSEEEYADDIDLQTLIKSIPIKNDRAGSSGTPLYNFSYIDMDRNTTMLAKTSTDKAFAATLQHAWKELLTGPPPMQLAVITIYKTLVERYQKRGGRVIFLRLPSSGWLRLGENKMMPRDAFWDVLLNETHAQGYHYEDYEVLSRYDLPECSHLATPDAKAFTRDLATILIKDKIIPHYR